jgi:hypothetical protein
MGCDRIEEWTAYCPDHSGEARYAGPINFSTPLFHFRLIVRAHPSNPTQLIDALIERTHDALKLNSIFHLQYILKILSFFHQSIQQLSNWACGLVV